MRTVFAIAFALLTTTHATDARSLRVKLYSYSYTAPSALIVGVNQPENPARERAWEAFCKPTPRVDALGVTRYSYAHEGCEFGRIE